MISNHTENNGHFSSLESNPPQYAPYLNLAQNMSGNEVPSQGPLCAVETAGLGVALASRDHTVA